MPASKIRSDYEGLREIAGEFTRQAEACTTLLSDIQSKQGSLRSGHWIGNGADKFYAEMDSAVLPSLERLVHALGEAARVTTKVSQIMGQAERDAAVVLGGGLGAALGASGPGTDPLVEQAGEAAGQSIGAQLGRALAEGLMTHAAGGPEAIGAAIGAAVAASTVIQGVGAEAGAAIGAAVRGVLGQGAASSAIGSAVANALTSAGLLTSIEQSALAALAQAGAGAAAQGAVTAAVATLTGVMGSVSGKVTLGDLSSLNFADVAVTPTMAGPVPIPYPNVQMGFGIGQGLGDSLNSGNVSGFASSMMQALGSGEQSATALNLQVQMAMEQWKRSYELVSNILKTFHEMSMTAINNTRS